MILFYLDESGTGLKDERSPYFVLCALSMDAGEWSQMDSKVAVLKRHLVSWSKPEDFEIKGRDMRRGEKFFRGLDWESRIEAFSQTADLLLNLPCQAFAVQVDKRHLPEYVASDSDLYRVAFWRLLEELDTYLEHVRQPGMLMVDMRSDMHSSVQDRRLLDAYREWIGSRLGRTRLVETPWFGFSAFYAGLQLADFTAYLLDFVSNEMPRDPRDRPLYDIAERLRRKARLVRIP